MSNTSPFFIQSANLEIIERCRIALRSYTKNHSDSKIENFLIHILQLMHSNAPVFDEYSTFNINWVGDDFISSLIRLTTTSNNDMPEAISRSFCYAFRFLLEVEFMKPSETNFQSREVEDFVDNNLDQFTPTDRRQIIFTKYQMPVQIAKELLNDPGMRELRSFSQDVEKANTLKNEWKKEISQQRTHIDELKNTLGELTSDYNFVGLVHGFKKISTEKLKERKYAFNSLIFLAILMLIPPGIQIYHLAFNTEATLKNKEILLYAIPASITIEIILIYFFRVVLGHFRSIKTQTLQIDLRIALCQFVQSYAEYATKVKANDKNLLEKFESVVFSSLVPDGDNIPSTFDGTEKIAQLIKSIRVT